MKYQSYGETDFITGLRGVAVVAVLLYHLGFGWIPGGFVGVDVFFVISGFVIFKSVSTTIEAGTYSTLGFFKKRFYRLHPALFAVVIVTLCYAYFVVSPAEYIFLAESGLYAIFGLSNVFFQDNAGNYFSSSAEGNPLLHTWSLGVETQFYLLAAAIFAYAAKGFRRERVVALLLILFLVSLLLNIVDIFYFGRQHNSFYLPTHRIWELCCGALLALYASKVEFPKLYAQCLSVFGGVVVVLSFFFIHNTGTFPGLHALMPVAGTGLVLLCLKPGSALNAILVSTPFRWLGLISYSLYLVHWPIVVFYKLQTGLSEIPVAHKLILLASSILLATLLYTLVEMRFRYAFRGSAKVSYTVAAACVLPVVVVAFTIQLQAGLPHRIDDKTLAALDAGKHSQVECGKALVS